MWNAQNSNVCMRWGKQEYRSLHCIEKVQFLNIEILLTDITDT